MTFMLFEIFMHEEPNMPKQLELIGYDRIVFSVCKFRQFVQLSTQLSRTHYTRSSVQPHVLSNSDAIDVLGRPRQITQSGRVRGGVWEIASRYCYRR